jgi:electron transport complex protein RnfA
MLDLLLIAIKYSLVSNVVLSQFLGICAFLGVSKKVDSSKGMGAAVIFVIVLASLVSHAIYVTFMAASSPLCKAL